MACMWGAAIWDPYPIGAGQSVYGNRSEKSALTTSLNALATELDLIALLTFRYSTNLMCSLGYYINLLKI